MVTRRGKHRAEDRQSRVWPLVARTQPAARVQGRHVAALARPSERTAALLAAIPRQRAGGRS